MSKKPSKSFKVNNPNLRPPKMSHVRHIKPEYPVHDGVNNMTINARYAETYAWTACDKHGRFEWNPRSLKRLILPYDNVEFEPLMLEWVREGFCERYEVDGKQYARFLNWEKHQAINVRERDSSFEYPAPPVSPEPAPTLHRKHTEPAHADICTHMHTGALHEGKGEGEGNGNGNGDGNGKGECQSSSSPSEAERSPEPKIDEDDDGGSIGTLSEDNRTAKGQDQIKVLSDCYRKHGSGNPFNVGKAERARLPELIAQHGFEAVQLAVRYCAGIDFEPEHPAAYFISRFDEFLAAGKENAEHYPADDRHAKARAAGG